MNPFAGVYHWERALRLVQRVQGNVAPPMKKFLVAARVDRGGIGVSGTRIKALRSEFMRRGCPVIPVLLADAPQEPQLPIFLRGMTWVDFREREPEPMERLVWGITGARQGRVFQG